MGAARAFGTTVLGLCLSLGMSAPLAGTVAQAAPAAGSSEGSIRITGAARVVDEPGTERGTTIAIPVHLRCPRGEHGYALFAGLPGYFSDGRFAEPYLPGHTRPAMVTCTGHPQRLTVLARSISRLQDPSTTPFEHFRRGRATAVVTVLLADGSSLTGSGSIRIVVPGRPG